MFRLLVVVSATPPEIPLACFYGADDLKGSCRLNQPNDVEQQTWGREKVRRAGVRKRLQAVRFGQEWSLSFRS